MKQTPESKDRKSFDRQFLLVLLVFALALFLRLWGICWGLPNELHRFSYHPDELPLLSAALRIDPTAGQFNPAFYNYPSFYIYLTSFSITLTSAWGLVSSLRDIYLVARIIVALMGAGSVFLVYYAGRKWYGKSTGLIAATFMAIVPLSVVNSHYATVDVPAALWVTACLAAASALKPASRARTYLLAGLLAGLAAGTKYNAGAVIIVPLIAHFVQCHGSIRARLSDFRFWLIPVAAVIGFIVTTPGVILYYDDFRRGLGFELWHAGSGHGFVFANTGSGWLYTFTSSFLHGLGVPLAIFTLVAVIFAFIKREKADWPLLAFFVCYYLLISFSEVRFSRYALPLIPVVSLFVGRMFSVNRSGITKTLWGVAAVFFIAHTLLYSLSINRLFVGEDSREEAINWIKNNTQTAASIGLASVPWFYAPPFADGFGLLRREDRLESARKSNFNLVLPEDDWDNSVLSQRPEYVVISDYEKLDALRARYPQAVRFMGVLQSQYKLVRLFGAYKVYPCGVSTRDLPHDMKYMNPTIWVYKRIQGNG